MKCTVDSSEIGLGNTIVLPIYAKNAIHVAADFTDGGAQHCITVKVILLPITIEFVVFVNLCADRTTLTILPRGNKFGATLVLTIVISLSFIIGISLSLTNSTQLSTIYIINLLLF